MKLTVNGISQSLVELAKNKNKRQELVEDKDFVSFDVVIQNISDKEIYLEKGEKATPEEWYILYPNSELSLQTPNIQKINLCTAWDEAEIRVLTN